MYLQRNPCFRDRYHRQGYRDRLDVCPNRWVLPNIFADGFYINVDWATVSYSEAASQGGIGCCSEIGTGTERPKIMKFFMSLDETKSFFFTIIFMRNVILHLQYIIQYLLSILCKFSDHCFFRCHCTDKSEIRLD